MTSLRKFSILLLVVAALGGILSAPAQAQLNPNCSVGSLPNPLIVGTFYNMPCVPTGGSGSYSFGITSGQAPQGMSLSQAGTQGNLIGQPGIPGTYLFTITVTDNSTHQTGSQNLTLTVSNSGGTGTGGLSLSSVSPTVFTPNVQSSITVSGSGFTNSSVIVFNNIQLATSFLSTTQLFASVPAAYLTGGTASVYVHDNGTGLSTGTITVTVSGSGGTGGISLTSMSQTSASVGGAGFTLILYGSGFSQGATVNFGSLSLGSTFVSSNQIQVFIPNTALTVSQTVNVSVGGSAPLQFVIGTGSGSSGGLTINCSPNSGPTGIGAFYQTLCSVNGGNGAYTWSATNLPMGVNFNTTAGSTVQILGTPTSAVSNSFTITVTDTSNKSGSLTLTGNLGIIGGGGTSISSLSPPSFPVGSVGGIVVVFGSGFTPSSVVYFNGSLLPTQYVSANQLNATLSSIYLTVAENASVTVITSGASSNTQTFTVGSGGGTGGVSLSSISPSSVPAGSPAQTVTFFGTGFSQGMLANFGTFTLSTTFISSGQVQVTIPNQYLLTAQTYNVTVGTSNAVPFTVGTGSGSGSLQISCSPTTGPTALNSFFSQNCSVFSGTSPFTWTVSGLPAGLAQSQYTGGSSVTISGTPYIAGSYSYTVQVTDGSASRLTGSQVISGSLGTSNYNISSLSPSSVNVSSPDITLTVLGTGFTNASLVQFNGITLNTTYVSSTQLNAFLPAAYMTTAQTANITVNTSGIPTNSQTFTVGSGTSGGSLSLTCTPGIGPSTVNTFFSTTCTASGGSNNYNWPIPSGLPSYLTYSTTTGSTITISGTPTVSSPYNFQVKVTDTSSPVQTGTLQLAGETGATSSGSGGIVLTSLSPSSAAVGSQAINMTVIGGGFSTNSQVIFDGFPIVTTFISGSQLLATIPAGQLTFARAVLVTVSTAGAGTSNGLSFIIGNGGTGIQMSITCSPGVGPAAPNSYYTSNCGVNGGNGPYNWSIVAGSLPTGLSLQANGALSTITGYTTLNGVYTYTLQVTDSSASPNTAQLVFAGSTGAGSGGGTGGLSISALSPLSAPVGPAAIILTVTGSGFNTSSIVYLNGAPLATTYVSAGQLNATIPAGNLAQPQSESITVVASGQTSNALTFTVGTVTTSAISISCNPTIGPNSSGSTYTTTCTATGGRAPYSWQGIGLPFGVAVTFSTSSTVQITGTLFTQSYNYSLQVTDSSTPAISATYPFSGTITGASATTISSMSPISVPAGGGQFNLIISGSGFVAGGTTVQFGNTPLQTSVNSPNQLSAIVPANLITNPGTINVQLSGSGSSNIAGFFVTTGGASGGVTPSSLTFTYGIGGTLPAAQTLSVSSLGGATGFSIVPNGVANGLTWLVLNQGSGTIPGSVSVSAAPSGLPVGSYSGTLTLTGFGTGTSAVIPVTLNVVGPPALVPSITNLNLTAGAGATVTQTIKLTTSDGSTILPYNVTATSNNGGNWLSVTPASGSTPGSITVTANAANLIPSTYSGSITVTSTGTLGSQITIPVTLTVTAATSLTVSPLSMTFTSQVGSNPQPQTVTVGSSSNTAINYTVLGTTQQGGGWLAATPTGTTPGSISVEINTSGLAAGTYNGTVTITAPGTSNSPVAIPITLNLTAAGSLTASPQSLTFSYTTGASNPPAQTISVGSSNNSSLSFSVTPTMTTGTGWLSASPATGTTPGSVSVTVTPGGLAAGTYTGSITVAATGSPNAVVPVTLTVTSVAASIVAVPANLAFFVPGDGSTPAPQSITVVSSGSNAAFTASAVAQGGNWLTVTPNGTTPGSVVVTVNPAGLFPGQSYNGSITINAPTSTPPSIQVPVTLTLAAQGALPLQVIPQAVYLNYPQGSGSDLQHVTVLNVGGGNVSFTATGKTSSCGSWLNVVTPTGSATASTPGLLGFNVNPSGLNSQTCRGTLTVTDGNGNSSNVPVYMAISGQSQAILLSQTAMNFAAVAGGAAPPAQTFQVLNPGSGSMPWSIATQVLSGGTWLSVAPNSGTAQSLAQSGSPINVNVNPQGLAAGTYYGTVVVSATGTSNSPQSITVSLTVAASGSAATPLINPSGVIITANGGTSDTQTVTISNGGSSAVTYTTALVTDDGQSWLVASPSTGSVGAGGTAPISLSANLSGLSTGLRHGTLRVAFSSGVVQSVDVQLAMSGSAGAGTTGVRACGSSSLATEFLSPAPNFTVSARVAIPLQVMVKDCSGNTLTNSSTGVDVLVNSTDVHLSYTGNGIWSGTWTPASAAPVVNLTAYAVSLTGGGASTGSVTATGTVSAAAANAPPVVSAVVNAGSFLLPGLVAPGTMVSIFGSGLADGQSSVFSTPFPNSLQGAQFSLRGLPLPLFYVSDGQVNAIVPLGIAANERDQLIVVRDTTQSVPVDLLVADVDPGVFATNQQGTGQGAILVGGTSQVAAPAGSLQGAGPATAGQYLSIFISGLGVVSNPPADGSPSTGTSLTPINPVVTIGGVPATVSYSGLAPGEVGLYQVNVQVPTGVPTGDAVPVVVTMSNGIANTVTVALQ